MHWSSRRTCSRATTPPSVSSCSSQVLSARFHNQSQIHPFEGGPILRSSNCLEGFKKPLTSRAKALLVLYIQEQGGLSNGRLRNRLKKRILERCPLSAIVRRTTFAMSVTWRRKVHTHYLPLPPLILGQAALYAIIPFFKKEKARPVKAIKPKQHSFLQLPLLPLGKKIQLPV